MLFQLFRNFLIFYMAHLVYPVPSSSYLNANFYVTAKLVTALLLTANDTVKFKESSCEISGEKNVVMWYVSM